MYRISFRTAASLLTLALCISSSVAQDKVRLEAQLKDLESAVDNIANEMNLLSVQLVRAQESFGPQHPKVVALQQQIAVLQQHLQERVDTELQVQQVHAQEVERQLQMRIAELAARRKELEAVSRDIRESEDEIVMSPEALKLMAQRIGEAQIENRLRELESKALIEALTTMMKDYARPPAEQAEIELQKNIVTAKRTAFDRVVKLFEKGYISDPEREAAAVELQQAEQTLRNLQNNSPRKTELDSRVADAATQRAVSIAMQKLLVAEARRINELLKKSTASQEVQSEAALVRDQMNQLKQQLMQVEIQSTMQSKELTRLNLLLRQADKDAATSRKQEQKKQ